MSEFDDFVNNDKEKEEKHQPKSQTQSREESQQTSTTSPSTVQEQDERSQSSQDQTEAIADSTPQSWDRKQFAMFFKETEVFEYEDLMYDTKGHLKRGYNVRNDKRYELDQAFMDLALERVSPEEVAARLIENRGFEP